MSEMLSKADFRVFQDENREQLREIKDLIHGLADYQREQNGNVARLTTQVAVHEERLGSLKDSKARWLSGVGAALALIGSWLLSWFGPRP